ISRNLILALVGFAKMASSVLRCFPFMKQMVAHYDTTFKKEKGAFFFSSKQIVSCPHIPIDTSGLRVQGKGEINFKTNEIDFHMKPMPKSAHFFSLATPISVTGPFTDLNLSPCGRVLKRKCRTRNIEYRSE
ncbi:MAG: hypothetical protein U9R57_02280, partial [Thermodesulfobacteriota bacterium]|nr:hypothetical protein [Thermodesulfobacteriota bacterium]